jgi:hypothetical protein
MPPVDLMRANRSAHITDCSILAPGQTRLCFSYSCQLPLARAKGAVNRAKLHAQRMFQQRVLYLVAPDSLSASEM